jgi:hypothetical protein
MSGSAPVGQDPYVPPEPLPAMKSVNEPLL